MLQSKKLSTWLPNVLTDVINNNDWLTKAALQTSPAINIIENDQAYIVEFAAPGLTKQDFKININDDNCLVVSVSKEEVCCIDKSKIKDKKEENTKESTDNKECCTDNKECCTDNKECCTEKYIQREFSYFNFTKTLIIPSDVDKEKIDAKWENGVLTLSFTKVEIVYDENSKEIKIK